MDDVLGERTMTENQIVFWNVNRLAKEFDMTPRSVGILLRRLGAKRWSKSAKSGGSVWYYDPEERED